MMRATFLGSASSAARALLTASVSGSERYSTPSGERYCTGGTPVWRAPSAGPIMTAAATTDVHAVRRRVRIGMRRILLDERPAAGHILAPSPVWKHGESPLARTVKGVRPCHHDPSRCAPA